MAKMVYRLKNNPDKRGFYVAAYKSELTNPDSDEYALGITAHLTLVEKVECVTRKSADKTYSDLQNKYADFC